MELEFVEASTTPATCVEGRGHSTEDVEGSTEVVEEEADDGSAPPAGERGDLLSLMPTRVVAAAEAFFDYWCFMPVGLCVLNVYLCWYLAVITFNATATSSKIWYTSILASFLVGIALNLNAYHGENFLIHVKKKSWMIFRFFLIPFCVSSYSAMAISNDFAIIFPKSYAEYIITASFAVVFFGYVFLVKLLWRRVRSIDDNAVSRTKQRSPRGTLGMEPLPSSSSSTIQLDQLRQLLDLAGKEQDFDKKARQLKDIVESIDRLLGWEDGAVGMGGAGRYLAPPTGGDT